MLLGTRSGNGTYNGLRKEVMLGAFAVGCVLAISGLSAIAEEVDYSGKRIAVIVPFSEGGGTDSYSRFMAPYFEKHLPGHPKIVVINRPGGGGLTGVNYYAARAEKDGTWVLALSTSSQSNYMLGDKRANFKMEDFIPIILSPRGITQYVRNTLGIEKDMTLKAKLDRLRSLPREKLVFGGKTPTSGGLALRTALSLLGIEVNSVWGLGGNGPMALAFERGEFTMSYDNTLSFLNNRSHMIKSGMAVPLYTFGVINEDGSISRDPALPDVPTFDEAYEAVNGKKPSGTAYEAWRSLMAVSVPLSKSWNLMAGSSPEVIKVWRDAAKAVYAEVMKDPKGQKIFGPYKNIMSDAAIAIRDQGTTLKPEAAKWLSSYVKDHFNMTIAAKTSK
jgi:tripartite-type tricarboxylate transporter receptor subunit TctC